MEVEMSAGIFRTVLALVILGHGIGHVLFLAPCLGIAQWGQSAHSWLLSGLLGDTATRVVGSLLWLVVTAGFVAASVGLLGQQSWWRTLAVGAAAVSVLSLVLFLNGRPTQSVLSAALMDVAILVALLWVHWPSADLVGA
jgi:hypothetical protein